MTAERPMEDQQTSSQSMKAEPNGEMPPVDVDITPSTGIIDRVIEGSVGKALKHASVRTVFGEPVTEGDRTVIPVARVTANYGFGAGSGRSSDEDENQTGSGSGGGGGGRVKANPIGYIELTAGEARFVPIIDRSAMMAIFASVAGFVLFLTLPRLIRGRQ
jgi:uncharacterized spore protein YtfJ